MVAREEASDLLQLQREIERLERKLETLKGEWEELMERHKRIACEISFGDPEDRLKSMMHELTSKRAEIVACERELQAARGREQLLRSTMREAERLAVLAEILQVRQEQEKMKPELERLKAEMRSTFDFEKLESITDLLQHLLQGWQLKESEMTKLTSKLEALQDSGD